MKYRLTCQQCQTAHVSEGTPEALPEFAEYLEHAGCTRCGGRAFLAIDPQRDHCGGVDADCTCGGHFTDLYAAMWMFMFYMREYEAWCEPTEGAVTPDLGEFFRRCDPGLPALVHWARWLRIEHAHERRRFTLDPEQGERLLEAMITARVKDRAQARLMRRAFHDGFGTHAPGQRRRAPRKQATPRDITLQCAGCARMILTMPGTFQPADDLLIGTERQRMRRKGCPQCGGHEITFGND
jgi:hypothetical protein